MGLGPEVPVHGLVPGKWMASSDFGIQYHSGCRYQSWSLTRLAGTAPQRRLPDCLGFLPEEAGQLLAQTTLASVQTSGNRSRQDVDLVQRLGRTDATGLVEVGVGQSSLAAGSLPEMANRAGIVVSR